MKFRKFVVSRYSKINDDIVYYSEYDKELSAFIAEDKKSVNIRMIQLVGDYTFFVFYDDIVPGIEKNGDRFTGLDV
jgi:hypothetical protein